MVRTARKCWVPLPGSSVGPRRYPQRGFGTATGRAPGYPEAIPSTWAASLCLGTWTFGLTAPRGAQCLHARRSGRPSAHRGPERGCRGSMAEGAPVRRPWFGAVKYEGWSYFDHNNRPRGNFGDKMLSSLVGAGSGVQSSLTRECSKTPAKLLPKRAERAFEITKFCDNTQRLWSLLAEIGLGRGSINIEIVDHVR